MPENGKLSAFECIYSTSVTNCLSAAFWPLSFFQLDASLTNLRKAPGQHAPGTTLVQLTKAHLFHPNSLRLRVAVSLNFFVSLHRSFRVPFSVPTQLILVRSLGTRSSRSVQLSTLFGRSWNKNRLIFCPFTTSRSQVPKLINNLVSVKIIPFLTSCPLARRLHALLTTRN